jgi:hypothetical protein
VLDHRVRGAGDLEPPPPVPLRQIELLDLDAEHVAQAVERALARGRHDVAEGARETVDDHPDLAAGDLTRHLCRSAG